MNICTAVNSKYLRYLYVMLTSLFENNVDGDIDVYVLQADLSDIEKESLNILAEKYAQRVNCIRIDTKRFIENLPTTLKFSLETYFRLLLVEILPEIDRLLYLDVDIIVRKSLRDLYNTVISDEYIAACKDMIMPYMNMDYQRRFNRFGKISYFNAGVMLMNLNTIRRDFVFEDFMRVARDLDYNLPDVDQDILNYLMWDNVKWVDEEKYNHMPVSVLMDHSEKKHESDPVIVHFAALNPWAWGPKSEIYKEWWGYAKKTPFYTELLEEQVLRLEEDVARKQSNTEQTEMQRQVMEALFAEVIRGRLKELSHEPERSLGIYGAGLLAERFYELLVYEGIEDIVGAVVDKKRTEAFHKIPILRSCDETSGEWLFVVTPTYETTRITEKLKDTMPERIRLVSLLDFLRGDGEKW